MSASTALVTGASSGIGRELAKLLAADGHDLLISARSGGALRDLAASLERRHGVRCRVIACDLSATEGVDDLVASADEAGVEVELLVNNAGFGTQGPFREEEVAVQLDMVRLNVTTLTELTGRLLPGMIERGRGGILNVASTAAFQPGPYMAVYYATKAYVLSFSEALHHELRGTGVTVTALCPGPTRTGFQESADMEDVIIGKTGLADAGDVARAGLRGLRAGRRVVIPGLSNRLGAAIVGCLPRGLVLRLVARLNSS